MRIPRSNEIDFLRLILAISVVFHHAGLATTKTLLPWLENIPAVPLFFSFSGLLVTESYLNSPSMRVYVLKRMRRIYPAYCTVVVLGAAIIWGASHLGSLPNSGSIADLLSYYFYNLLFLGFLQPCLFNIPAYESAKDCAINGSLWTLKFELFFYLMVPFCCLIFRNFSSLFALALASLLLASTMLASTIKVVILICFLAGVLLSISKNLWLPLAIKFKISSQLRALIVLLLCIFSGVFLPLPLTVIALLFASFIRTNNSAEDLNLLKYGDLSYGIYLVHYPLIQLFRLGGIAPIIPDILFAPIIVLISGMLAALLYQVVEKKYLSNSSHYTQRMG